jgi:hypothetical protein
LRLPWRQRILCAMLFGAGFIVCIAGGIRIKYGYLLTTGYDKTWLFYPTWICGTIELYLGIVSTPPALSFPAKTSSVRFNTTTNNHPDRRHHTDHQTPHPPLLPQPARHPLPPLRRPPFRHAPHPGPPPAPAQTHHLVPRALHRLRHRARQAPTTHKLLPSLRLAAAVRQEPPAHPPARRLGLLDLSAVVRARGRRAALSARLRLWLLCALMMALRRGRGSQPLPAGC